MIRDWWEKYHTIITRLMDWFGIGGKTSHHYHRIDWWTGHGCIRKGVVEVRFMGWIDTEHQATQPAVLSTECKRCRATAKKNNEQKAKELEAKATETSSSELIVALSALPRAEEAPVPPPQSLNELMNHTLKDYHEECVDEGTWQTTYCTKLARFTPPLHLLSQPPDWIWKFEVQVSARELSRVFVRSWKNWKKTPIPKCGPNCNKVRWSANANRPPRWSWITPPRLKSSSAMASISQGNNPVAIFNGSMVLCGVPETKRNPSREDGSKNLSPHETTLAWLPCGRQENCPHLSCPSKDGWTSLLNRLKPRETRGSIFIKSTVVEHCFEQNVSMKKILKKKTSNYLVLVFQCFCHSLTRIPMNEGCWVG